MGKNENQQGTGCIWEIIAIWVILFAGAVVESCTGK